MEYVDKIRYWDMKIGERACHVVYFRGQKLMKAVIIRLDALDPSSNFVLSLPDLRVLRDPNVLPLILLL